MQHRNFTFFNIKLYHPPIPASLLLKCNIWFNLFNAWWRLLNVMFVRLQNYVGDAWKVKSVLMINVNFERLDLFQWDAWNQFGSINPADSFNLNVIKPQTTNVRHLNSNRSIQWLESKMKIDFKFNFNNGFLHYCSACWFVKCYIIIYSWPILTNSDFRIVPQRWAYTICCSFTKCFRIQLCTVGYSRTKSTKCVLCLYVVKISAATGL